MHYMRDPIRPHGKNRGIYVQQDQKPKGSGQGLQVGTHWQEEKIVRLWVYLYLHSKLF